MLTSFFRITSLPVKKEKLFELTASLCFHVFVYSIIYYIDLIAYHRMWMVGNPVDNCVIISSYSSPEARKGLTKMSPKIGHLDHFLIKNIQLKPVKLWLSWLSLMLHEAPKTNLFKFFLCLVIMAKKGDQISNWCIFV